MYSFAITETIFIFFFYLDHKPLINQSLSSGEPDASWLKKYAYLSPSFWRADILRIRFLRDCKMSIKVVLNENVIVSFLM